MTMTVPVGHHGTARDHWCAIIIKIRRIREGGARIAALAVEASAGIPGLLESFTNKFIRGKLVQLRCISNHLDIGAGLVAGGSVVALYPLETSWSGSAAKVVILIGATSRVFSMVQVASTLSW